MIWSFNGESDVCEKIHEGYLVETYSIHEEGKKEELKISRRYSKKKRYKNGAV